MEYYAVIKSNEKTFYVKHGHPLKDINFKKLEKICRVCPSLCKNKTKYLKKKRSMHKDPNSL